MFEIAASATRDELYPFWKRPREVTSAATPFGYGRTEELGRESASATQPAPSRPSVRMSESALGKLAAIAPDDFLELLASNCLHWADLTYAAELAGTIRDSTEVVSILAGLLGHNIAVVREGAVYGLAQHMRWSRQAGDALRERLQVESSDGVREALEEVLDYLDE